MDMKVKEDQIRELELKVQVREEQLTSLHFSSSSFCVRFVLCAAMRRWSLLVQAKPHCI